MTYEECLKNLDKIEEMISGMEEADLLLNTLEKAKESVKESIDRAHTLIKHLDRIKQPIDYVGILRMPIAPTDIDGIIDWKNSGWIILECKRRGKDLDFGQKLMHETLVNDLSVKKPAICVVFDHDVDNPDIPIKAGECRVRSFYTADKGWVTMKKDILLKDYIPELIKRINVLNGNPESFGNFLI